jgi:23S rRNA (guanine2445-N2)-methyltransferase / 23S rRNA (guanine2069-N7)-methyltransferase
MEADRERRWLATCPRGCAPLLADELEELGAEAIVEQGQGVLFNGSRATMYRVCLWSRTASRVLLPLGDGPAADAEELYATLLAMPWAELFSPGATIAVSFSGTNTALRNTRFGAQRSKDAILDACRAAGIAPPRVQLDGPDITVSVRLRDSVVDVALDMVGESLHRRGYRRGSGVAPIKENLAAALLLRAGWKALAGEGAALVDPLCGAATLLIEGAFIALDRAPALGRERFAFQAWRGHEPAQWEAVVAEARGRAQRGAAGTLPEIRGYDGDPRVIRRAEENIAAAGLSRCVRVGVKALHEVRKPTHRPLPMGLVITNPPYGQRLGESSALPQLYRRLGELLHAEFSGWEAAVLAPDAELGRALGLRSHRHYAFYNGRLPITLYLLSLRDNRLADRSPEAAPARASRKEARHDPERDDSGAHPVAATGPIDDAGAGMLANRLRKNQRRLAKWLKKSAVECYRLYDADLPEYAVAVDVYGDWLHVAEYRAPESIPEEVAAQRLATIQAVLPVVTGVPVERIVYKRRERQRGEKQYQRRGRKAELLTVHEGAARLLVNLHDYLDTGLFLDHRALRLRIAGEAAGRRFLNLFCYTGSATVHAALGGARHTVSVDLSKTYLDWLGKNLALNGLPDARHQRERADVMAWLKAADNCFDLILLDPPSFSNSKRTQHSFDVQADHGPLIEACMARLAPNGTLYFSSNRRRFRLDAALTERFSVDDITRSTLDPDFPRSPPPHRCWRIRHRGDVA